MQPPPRVGFDQSLPKYAPPLSSTVSSSSTSTSAVAMPSRAAIAAAAPVAMLFVRNEKGISHSPLENMSEADAGIAIRVLLETILELAGRSK